ncbi:MAG: heavy-metal-associated domain-containing protein [Coriobacteriales bacterium]|jgi:copper chaperone CopZ
MIRTTLGIEGMACSMCEAHINDAIRRNFDVKKVKANRRKRTCVIESASPLDEERLRGVIAEIGYTLTSIQAG